jgi:hypothetical protein
MPVPSRAGVEDTVEERVIDVDDLPDLLDDSEEETAVAIDVDVDAPAAARPGVRPSSARAVMPTASREVPTPSAPEPPRRDVRALRTGLLAFTVALAAGIGVGLVLVEATLAR